MLGGCGVGMEGELPVDETGEGPELASTQQAVTSVNNCATGETPNAIGWLGSSDGYTRARGYANPGICASPRATTIVDFNGVANTRYRFNAQANFGGGAATDMWKCFQSRVAMRTLKKVGSSWVQVDYQEVIPSWNGSGCFGGPAKILTSAQYSSVGDYRVRAQAIRWDGTYETVSIYGAYWN
jgi:hypothetical protein